MEYSLNDIVVVSLTIFGVIYAILSDYADFNEATRFKILKALSTNKKEILSRKDFLNDNLSEEDKNESVDIYTRYIQAKLDNKAKEQGYFADTKSILDQFKSKNHFHYAQIQTGVFKEKHTRQGSNGTETKFFFVLNDEMLKAA